MNVRALIATGCGTAIACVCAIGLFQIEQTVGGLWAIAAVLIAGMICAVLARVFSRLSTVVPSGAGLLAYLSRGLGRRAGLAIAIPYLLLTLFLVGVEATIVGTLLARVVPGLPAAVGALVFLVGTWAFCRAGFQVGFKAQAIATFALVAGLAALAAFSIFEAGERGELAARMLTAAPPIGAFITAIGTAIFLFMGFELVTSQAEHAAPRAISRGLTGSVVVLTAFYALVSAGFSCLVHAPIDSASRLVPQLAIAEQTGSPLALGIMVALCLLASFTSFNGALLALSRFAYALASQGALPRTFARLDPKTLVPRQVLALLLALAIGFTAIVLVGGVLEPAILAAAVAASLLYAAAAWVRERPAFAEAGRSPILGRALAIGLVAVGVGVIVDAGQARLGTLVLLGVAFVVAAAIAARVGGKRRRPSTPIGMNGARATGVS
jgi:amino acid transporter